MPADKLGIALNDNNIQIALKADVKLQDLQNTGTGAIVQLKKLIDENGLKSIKLGNQQVELSNNDDTSALVQKILTAYDSLRQERVNEMTAGLTDVNQNVEKATELAKKGLVIFAGKEYEVLLKFDVSRLEKYKDCNLGDISLNYKVTFKDEIAPTPFELKDEFANSVGEAIKKFNLPEGVSATYDKENRKAIVEITEGTDLSKITNSNAVSELKKLVDQKGLISFKLDSGTENDLEGKSEEELKTLIISELLSKYDANIETQEIKATVKFKSVKVPSVQAEEDYTLVVKILKKMTADEGAKLDSAFDYSYKQLMNAANNQAQKKKINNHTPFKISYANNTFTISFNENVLEKSILNMQSTGLATGMVAMLTGTNKGTDPQKNLHRTILVEKASDKKVILEKTDLDKFKGLRGYSGMINAANKGVPGFGSSTKLSELVGKELTITYEYRDGNKVYIKKRTLKFDRNFTES